MEPYWMQEDGTVTPESGDESDRSGWTSPAVGKECRGKPAIHGIAEIDT
jgi:hypothetical protein